MKHTTMNKILNALTLGLLNRILDLEYQQNISIVETASGFNKLGRIDTDMSALAKEVYLVRDELTSLRHSSKSLVIAEVVKAMDLPTILNIIKEQTAHEVEVNLDRKIRLHGLVMEKDLPDWDDFVKYEAHGDEVLTVDNMKETIGEEMEKDYFEDHIRTIVKNLCNDQYATDDRVREIITEVNDEDTDEETLDEDRVRDICRDEISDSESTTSEDRVLELIAGELGEKNYATTHEAEVICEDAIDAHETKHHSEDEEDDVTRNQDEEAIVLTGKMVSVDIANNDEAMVLTDTEKHIVLIIRAYNKSVDPSDADTMQEVISEIADDDDRRALIDTMLMATAEYSFGMGLWHEEMAHSLRKEGRQSEALYSSTIAHGYDETGQAINAVPDVLKRAEQHASFVSERITDK